MINVKLLSFHVIDLASVPAEHLASLASCVTWTVDINGVSNYDIISLLNSVKCERLYISNHSLSSEETGALVRAMETRVEKVRLGIGGDVSLDIRALTQYSGQGKCQWVQCDYETADKYREEVRSWAEKINWKLERLMRSFFGSESFPVSIRLSKKELEYNELESDSG